MKIDRITLTNATERALEAFWNVVAREIPGDGGDLSPDVAAEFAITARHAVSEWAEANAVEFGVRP